MTKRQTFSHLPHFQEEAQMLLGDRGVDYRLGDRVLVEVIKANKEERAVDFKIIKKL